MEEVRVLTPTAPFDFAATLAALGSFTGSPDRRDIDPVGGCLRQAWRVDGEAVVAELRSVGALTAPALTLRVARGAPAATMDRLERVVRRDLAIDLDVDALERVADPAFVGVLERLRGYHPPRFPSPFEAACWALVRQRTPMSFATASMERLLRGLGETVREGGAVYDLFPRPCAFDDAARPALLAATNNLRKVDRLVATAARFARLDEATLERAPYDEVASLLLEAKGLGRWSVEFILWRALGRYERVPWSDTGALEAISRVYAPGMTVARGTARELAERYGRSQGLWLTYLKRFVFTLGSA